MKKNAFVVMVLLISTGCSWVTRDYTFAPHDENGWKSEFIEASQPSVKDVPIPDKHLNTFLASGVIIKIWSGYTVVMTGGVWPLPIIPLSMFDQERLTVNVRVEAVDQKVEIDVDLIEVVDSSGSPIQFSALIINSSQFCKPQTVTGSIFVSSGESLEFILKTDFDVKKIDSLVVRFKEVKIGNLNLNVPELKLEKKRGSFNYDELTV